MPVQVRYFITLSNLLVYAAWRGRYTQRRIIDTID